MNRYSTNKTKPHIPVIASIDHSSASNIQITNFLEFIHKGNTEKMENYIENGFDLNVHDSNGTTPLIEAICVNFQPAVDLFLSNNADVNFPNIKGESPLMIAIGKKRSLIVEQLLEKKASCITRDPNGKTAMHLIVENDLHPRYLLITFINQCSLNDVDYLGRTPGDYVKSQVMATAINILKLGSEQLRQLLKISHSFIDKFKSPTSVQNRIDGNEVHYTVKNIEKTQESAFLSGQQENKINQDSSSSLTISPFSLSSQKAISVENSQQISKTVTGTSTKINPRKKLDFSSMCNQDSSEVAEDSQKSDKIIDDVVTLMDWLGTLKVGNKAATTFISRKIFDVPKFVRGLNDVDKVDVLRKMNIGQIGVIYRILAKVEIEESKEKEEIFKRLLVFMDEFPKMINRTSLRFSLNEANDCCFSNVSRKKVKTLEMWLKRHELENYLENFVSNGFDSLAFIYCSFLSKHYKFTESLLLKYCHIYDDKARKKIADTLLEDFEAFEENRLERFYLEEKNEFCSIF